MTRRLRGAIGGTAITAVVLGCGGAAAEPAGEPAEPSVGAVSGAESAAAPEAAWLDAVPEGGTLTYEVRVAGGAVRQVQMQVQQVVRRGAAIAIHLAPIGTPLDDEPVYPRWLVGEETMLAGLDETAALTEPGYAPIDDAGRMRTEAADNVAWRLPRDWLTPGRSMPGAEVSAGWTLTERVGEVSEPIAARDCARLVREEAGARESLLVCANVGLVESVTAAASGAVDEQWRLVAISARETSSDESAVETQ